MSAKDPATLDEYNSKYNRNVRYSGAYLSTTIHYACPGCAEPDFMAHKILEAEEAIAKGGVCAHCGRGFKGIVTKVAGGTSVEFVQTCGDDPPAYLPAMRRVP